jgi:hypothetical protein
MYHSEFPVMDTSPMPVHVQLLESGHVQCWVSRHACMYTTILDDQFFSSVHRIVRGVCPVMYNSTITGLVSQCD